MTGGRTAVVTGGASGIGVACAAVLARDGWRVGVLDLSAAAAKEVADALTGGGHIGAECDVTSATSVDAAVGQVAAGGPLGAVVACAGIARPHPAATADDDHLRAPLEVHTLGLIRARRAAFPHLTAAGVGAIVGVSSMGARLGLPHRLAYNAAKGAVDSVVRTLAVEWARQRNRVNAVAPGWVHTPAIARLVAEGRLDLEPWRVPRWGGSPSPPRSPRPWPSWSRRQRPTRPARFSWSTAGSPCRGLPATPPSRPEVIDLAELEAILRSYALEPTNRTPAG
jgi:NAD(P)-dependent dehydrogenase (short-subunit alcohol dehydrogenase family)